MKIRDTILQLGEYKPPLEGRNPDHYLLLDFNESPIPPPFSVKKALATYLERDQLHIYPSYGNFLEVLADYVEVDKEQLIFTNGSDQAIDLVLRLFLESGDEMVLAKPGFGMFFQLAATLGVQVRSPEYRKDMSFPFEELLECVSSKTKLIVVINPNNPTGTSISLTMIEELLCRFPHLPILVDEAYVEFTNTTCLSLLNQYSNLIIIRTFSKAFAIPSLRLGYIIGHAKEVIQHLYKIRGPYDVNMFAIIAAKAQLENPQEWKPVIEEIMTKSKPLVEQTFEEWGLKYYPADGNFMLVEPPNAPQMVQDLQQEGILVRTMRPPIEHTFRMNFGMLEQTHFFLKRCNLVLAKNKR